MFLLIDNYDSFTYNLWHYLSDLGAEVVVKRNDAMTVADVLAMRPEGIVISPGPSVPEKAGLCLDLVREAGAIPLLGVCLGHQAIGAAFGGRVVRAPEPMHGKVDRMLHDRSGVFAGLPSPFTATRYHSLIVEHASLPPSLRVTATSEDGLIMGLAHLERPIHGVQFHPESIASQHGHDLLRNFLKLAAGQTLAA
ncbi:MAG TPA: aminodeoxychorismate/anthranilate synthase component II [Stellaceae bacterium]